MAEHLLDMGATSSPARSLTCRASHLSAHTPQGISLLLIRQCSRRVGMSSPAGADRRLRDLWR